jgi:hypothetical protein
MSVQEMMQNLRTAITGYEMAAEQLDGVILGQGFVVRCQGVYLAFDIDGAGLVTNPRPSRPQMATRFTRSDASRIAATVRNGADAAGEVVHVRDAVAQELRVTRELLEQLQEREAVATGQYSVNIN